MNPYPNKLDPRIFQISVLGMLILFGLFYLDFEIKLLHILIIFFTAQITQYFCGYLVGLKNFDALSSIITAFSLILLLRTDSIYIAALAAIIAIGSKFLLRFRGKHIFNPANGAIILLMLVTDYAWVSAGQWGSTMLSAFALACLGMLVLNRARRAETTISFLVCWVLLILVRVLWLGDPISIAFHQLQNGALLVFAFFMISDPKTSPNNAIARYLYAALVAIVGFIIQYKFFTPNGPIWALALCAPIVPLLDYLLPDDSYQWHSSSKPLLTKPS